MSRFINVQQLDDGRYLAYYESWTHDCVRVFCWSREDRAWWHVEDLQRVVFNDMPDADDGETGATEQKIHRQIQATALPPVAP